MSVEQVLARVSAIQTAMGGGVATQSATFQGSGNISFGNTLAAQSATGVQGVGNLSGSVGQKMIALAQKEIGVTEQPPGSNDSPRIADYRKATVGSGIGPWCAYFTSWLAKSAGAPLGEQGQGFGGVDALYAWAQRTGRAEKNGPGVTPKAGDLIVFNEHIGLVESVDPNGTVHTIEGNSSNQVIRRTHTAREAIGYVHVG